MPTLAQLTLVIDSAQAEKAAQALVALSQAGTAAQNAAQRVEQQSLRTAQAHQTLELSTSNLLRTLTQLIGVYSAIQTARQALENVGTEARVATGLENLTHSATMARDIINQLHDVSNSGQFALPGLEDSARLLVSMGYSGAQVVPILDSITGALQAVGAPADSLERVVQSIVRMKDEGQISVFTLRQMETQGIAAGKILADAFGKTGPEVMTLVRNGSINASKALDILIEGMQKMATTAQADSQNVYVLWQMLKNNLINSLQDAAKAFLLFTLGGTNNSTFKGIVSDAQAFSAIMHDIVNVMEGGTAKFKQTNEIVLVLSVTFKLLEQILVAIIALKLIDFLGSLSTNLTGVVAILLILTAIDLYGWANKNGEAFRHLIDPIKELIEIAGVAREALANFFGNESSINPQRTGAARGLFEGTGGSYTDRINEIIRQHTRIQAGLQPGGPTTQPSSIESTGPFNFDSVLKDVSGFLSSAPDLGGLAGKLGAAIRGAVGQARQSFGSTNPQDALQVSDQLKQKLEEQIQKTHEEGDALLMIPQLRTEELNILKVKQELQRTGLDITKGEANALLQAYTSEQFRLVALKEVSSIATGVGDALGRSFGDFLTNLSKGKDAVKALAQELEKLAIQTFVTKPLSQGLSTAFTNIGANLFGLTGGGGSGPAPVSGAGAGGPDEALLSGSALGNVFWGGRMTAFAGGGIVDGPTAFGMNNGFGLMGEAGPEAIMPLARDRSGQLGIKGGGGGTTIVNQNAYVNVRANDPSQFRASMRQINQQIRGSFSKMQ